MDDSKEHIDYIEKINKLLSANHLNFFEFRHKIELGSQKPLANFIKCYMLVGAEKLFMSRKLGLLSVSDFDEVNEPNSTFKNGKFKGKIASKQTKKVSGVVNDHNQNFPLNLIAFLTVLEFKISSFQINLCLRFLSLPIWCLNLCLTLMMFPFETLTRMRDHMKKRLLKSCNACYFRLILFLCNSLKLQMSMVRVAVRSSKALLCAVYVLFLLSWLLVAGFVIGGVVMRNFVQESIHISHPLNFDYTKTSPAAVVPLASSFVDHKLRVTVSLTLPESEYNRNLGLFQVRVESLCGNGEVIRGSSYPTMLHFKSQPVGAIETLFKSVALITGLKSEVQTLKIVVGDIKEGYEPTAFLKVVLEKRAEFEGGSGVPETYGASIEIASELPQLKKILWSWRRTVFVWISFVSFVVEIMIFLIFCRPVILPGGRSESCKKPWHD